MEAKPIARISLGDFAINDFPPVRMKTQPSSINVKPQNNGSAPQLIMKCGSLNFIHDKNNVVPKTIEPTQNQPGNLTF